MQKSVKFGVVAMLVAALNWAVPAKATVINFMFDDLTANNNDVIATVTTDVLNNMLSLSGSVLGLNGAVITGLVPVGADPLWTNDNQMSTVSPFISNLGLLFDAGPFRYNLYEVDNGLLPPSYFLSSFNPDGSSYNPGNFGTFDAMAVPGPAVGTGLSGLLAFGGLIILAMRRRRVNEGLAV